MVWMSRLRLRLAARKLRLGGIVAYPTESVWGLGCDPLNAESVDALLTLKGRPASKGFILIAAAFAQIEPYLDLPSPDMRGRLLASWPGPVTWIVPAARKVPRWLRGRRDTLAVRVTAHPTASALCQVFGGAIVSTSANPSGKRPARTLAETRRYFTGTPLSFMPGPTGGLTQPTAIFDARSGARMR
jgi:L-threonylcarbamoyladenylate synthase